jgi:hypothetical protein
MVHSTLNEMPRQPNPFFMPPTNQPNPIQAMALSQQAQHIIPSLPEPEILDRIPPLPPDKIQTQSVHSVTEQKTESANNLIINLKKLEKANELAKTNELN